MLFVAAWCGALAMAFCLDRPIANWVHDSGLSSHLKLHSRLLRWTARLPGNFLAFTLVASAWLLILGRRWWRAAAFIFLGGVGVGVNSLLKWMVGRARPFQGEMFQLHPFVGGIHGLGGANQSFPSGDVCLAAATASCLAILFPRWQWIWFLVMAEVMVERVVEGSHFPSDTVAAAGLGWVIARCAWVVLGRPRAPASVPPSLPADIEV